MELMNTSHVSETKSKLDFKRVTEAKYYGIVLDSLLKISYVDQIIFIIRFVANYGVLIERFVCFVPNV